jgi:nitroreductase
MNFETVVKRRRMCREFLERDVPQEKIDRILNLELARIGSLHFILVDSPSD